MYSVNAALLNTVSALLPVSYTHLDVYKRQGRSCTELPSFIIRRLPVRYTYDNNYFTDRFQGIPMGGYTQICETMLKDADVLLNTSFED